MRVIGNSAYSEPEIYFREINCKLHIHTVTLKSDQKLKYLHKMIEFPFENPIGYNFSHEFALPSPKIAHICCDMVLESDYGDFYLIMGCST